MIQVHFPTCDHSIILRADKTTLISAPRENTVKVNEPETHTLPASLRNDSNGISYSTVCGSITNTGASILIADIHKTFRMNDT